jgi:transcriptional regulator with XRE-family HTH domain
VTVIAVTVTILTGFSDLSTGNSLAKGKIPERPGDPVIVDRITRAMGAYQFRTGKRMQWNDLADQSGLSQSTVSDIATLKRRVQIADAALFGDVLGVRPAWIAFGEEPMAVPPYEVTLQMPQAPEQVIPETAAGSGHRSETAGPHDSATPITSRPSKTRRPRTGP